MKAKALFMAAALCLLLTLTSCTTNFESNAENLMRPPQGTGEQAAIREAVQRSVGDNITWKFPKSGDYRSAFILYDIDKDGEDEAFVFYQQNYEAQSGRIIRICVLSRDEDRNWKVVWDKAGVGVEVEFVAFENITGTNAYDNMVVGYREMSSNKVLTIYEYGQQLENVYEGNYSLVEFIEGSTAGVKELLIVDQAFGQYRKYLRLVRGKDGKMVTSPDENDQLESFLFAMNMNENRVDVTTERVDDLTIVYVDQLVDYTEIATQVFAVKGGNLYGMENYDLQRDMTTRNENMPAVDFDGDGRIEIPGPSVGTREEYLQDQIERRELFIDASLQSVIWYEVSWAYPENAVITDPDRPSLSLVEKYFSYQNSAAGCYFIMPKGWIGRVNVETQLDGLLMRFSMRNQDIDLLQLLAHPVGIVLDIENFGDFTLIMADSDYEYYAYVPATEDFGVVNVIELDQLEQHIVPISWLTK